MMKHNIALIISTKDRRACTNTTADIRFAVRPAQTRPRLPRGAWPELPSSPPLLTVRDPCLLPLATGGCCLAVSHHMCGKPGILSPGCMQDCDCSNVATSWAHSTCASYPWCSWTPWTCVGEAGTTQTPLFNKCKVGLIKCTNLLNTHNNWACSLQCKLIKWM